MGYRTRWGKLKSLGRRLRETPAPKLGLLGHTFCLLLLAKLALLLLPVGRIIAWKQRKLPVCSLEALDASVYLQDVRWAVLVVSRYAPLGFVCFPQCLAASALLAGKGIASRLHYGVRRGAATAKLETHTWLEAAGEILIGGEVAGNFSTLEIY